jgi:hypothetical protein
MYVALLLVASHVLPCKVWETCLYRLECFENILDVFGYFSYFCSAKAIFRVSKDVFESSKYFICTCHITIYLYFFGGGKRIFRGLKTLLSNFFTKEKTNSSLKAC